MEADMAGSYVNQVRLVGRVSDVGEARQLPSGDTVHAWRLVVPREDKATRSGRKQPDVIDVVCWSAVTRRAAGRLQIGQDVEVEGALRRRFFRTAAGVGSRYEVEVRNLTRLRIESLP
jgi:single-strand DNA-binding protein